MFLLRPLSVCRICSAAQGEHLRQLCVPQGARTPTASWVTYGGAKKSPLGHFATIPMQGLHVALGSLAEHTRSL